MGVVFAYLLAGLTIISAVAGIVIFDIEIAREKNETK